MLQIDGVEGGLKGVNANLARLAGDQLRLAVERGLFEAAEEIAGQSKELTPVDTGNLRDSTFAITESLKDLGPTAEVSGDAQALLEDGVGGAFVNAVVGVGGPSAEYAIIQHERTDFHHRVGQAKFLETAVDQTSERLPEIVGASIRRMLEGQAGEVPGSGFE